MKTNVARNNGTPYLPFRQLRPRLVLTAGPEVKSTDVFDQKIVEFRAKSRIAAFLIRQEVQGRFERPVVSPSSLARTILKHSRKQLKRDPDLRLGAAIKIAGEGILTHYVGGREMWPVTEGFFKLVNEMPSR